MNTITKSKKYKGNPRKISLRQSELLKEHIEELGDLSGVVYCVNNKAYVGGNQRSDIFEGAEITIIERYDTPTDKHTLAHGFIEYKGEKYVYREVSFTEELFKKACIVANNDGGEWDFDILKEWDTDDLIGYGFEMPEFESGINDNNVNGKEYDESVTDNITICKCEKCGHEHTAKKD